MKYIQNFEKHYDELNLKKHFVKCTQKKILKIDDDKIDDKIKKEFSFLFQANKYNL